MCFSATEKKDEKVQIKLEETPVENKTAPIEKVEEIASTEQISEEKKSTDKTEVIKEETVTQEPVAKEE